MKIASPFLSILIVLLFAREVTGQAPLQQDSLPALRLEKINGHKRVLILQGKTIQYKSNGSTKFARGKITRITDSTVTFQNKQLGDVTIRHKDLTALIIPRSVGRKIAGYIPLTMGSVSFLAGLVFLSTINQDGDEGLAGFVSGIFLGAGALGILNGTILLTARKINLQNRWTVDNTKVIKRR